MCALKKNDRRSPNASGESPAATAASQYAMPFASVKASSCAALAPASRMWYPEIEIVLKLGKPLGAVREEVRREPHRRPRREDVVAARDVLLEHVVLHGAAELHAGDALAFADELVEQKEECRRRVDRHRRGDLGRGGSRRGAPPCRRASRSRRRCVRPRPRRAGRRSRSRAASAGRMRPRARSARVEQVAEACVRLLRRPVARVLPDRPRTPAVHRLVRAAGERELARRLELARSSRRLLCRPA